MRIRRSTYPLSVFSSSVPTVPKLLMRAATSLALFLRPRLYVYGIHMYIYIYICHIVIERHNAGDCQNVGCGSFAKSIHTHSRCRWPNIQRCFCLRPSLTSRQIPSDGVCLQHLQLYTFLLGAAGIWYRLNGIGSSRVRVSGEFSTFPYGRA